MDTGIMVTLLHGEGGCPIAPVSLNYLLRTFELYYLFKLILMITLLDPKPDIK